MMGRWKVACYEKWFDSEQDTEKIPPQEKVCEQRGEGKERRMVSLGFGAAAEWATGMLMRGPGCPSHRRRGGTKSLEFVSRLTGEMCPRNGYGL